MQLTSFGTRPGLERIKSLLQEMGNPEQDLKCVHIAGTNGKGSTSLIIADILIKAGYRVGRFTSPHLHSYLERITVNGREIRIETAESILDDIEGHIEVMTARGEEHPTEFEVLTALALHYFQNEQVDLAVLEVGMGGIYDSTNVIVPLVSIITGVEFDHIAYLGTSLPEIALNKAGIIKPGIPVIIGQMAEEARSVIEKRAEELNAPLYVADQIWAVHAESISLKGQIISITGEGVNLTGVKYTLLGDFQLKNLEVAFTSLQLLQNKGYRFDENSVRKSLAGINMPGRLEVLNWEPLVIADAAHNPQGAQAMADSLERLLPEIKKVIVMGLVDDKDQDGIISALGSNTSAVVVTKPLGSRGQNWQRVQNRWQEIYPFINIIAVENIAAAVEAGFKIIRNGEYMIITGSFYVLDGARRVFIKN